MKKLSRKKGVPAAAAVLFFLSLLLSAAAHILVIYGRQDHWYAMGSETGFENTASCTDYVIDAVWYVGENVLWQNELARDDLGAYAGSAFSYVVREDETGAVMADTRSENSVYVTGTSWDGEKLIAEQYTDSASAASGELGTSPGPFTVEGYINLPVEPYQGCYTEYLMYTLFFPFRYLLLAAKYVFLLLAVLSLTVLCFAAADRGRHGDLRSIRQMPFDLVFIITAFAVFVLYWLGDNAAYYLFNTFRTYTGTMPHRLYWTASSCGNYITGVLGLSFLLWYLAGELGAGILGKRMLMVRAFHRIPQWVFILGFLAVHLLLLLMAFEDLMDALPKLVLVLIDAAAAVSAIVYCRQARIVRQAADALAAGNLSYKTETRRLHFIWRALGTQLNSIGDGMAQAVEERMRSERMKTELITNVSHDLKTPLTSMINYIDLLKSNTLDPDIRREYLDILDKQSARLKKLTEDVVEASKAASGAVTVSTETIDALELLRQFLGEYEDRMANAGIEPVLTAPPDAVFLRGDSILLGRVIDNLIVNIVKYAQPDTRAYFDLKNGEDSVELVAKNVSRESLNISPEELMERFVRGDSARHTEGSGLGLSIARSLTELMGGTLTLEIEGDLFKAILRLPRVGKDMNTSGRVAE